MALDQRHSETVARILEAIATVTDETARGIIACEDAYVALHLGLSLGLSPMDIAAQHDRLMAETLAPHDDQWPASVIREREALGLPVLSVLNDDNDRQRLQNHLASARMDGLIPDV